MYGELIMYIVQPTQFLILGNPVKNLFENKLNQSM